MNHIKLKIENVSKLIFKALVLMKHGVLIYFMFLSFSLFSQSDKKYKDQDRCGTYRYNKELLKKSPNMMGSKVFEDKLNLLIKSYKKQRKLSSNKKAIITIPVVVHVLHNGEAVGKGPNVSDDQINSQITVLNQDYRKIINTRGFGQGVDTEIEFCLAKQTPKGCPTNGIDRVNIGIDGIRASDQETAIRLIDELKPKSIWDPNLYMNIWSVKITGGSGLLGYAQLPETGNNDTDGVVSDYRYFGSNDDPNVTIKGKFNLGRTMTHEVGHYLGLLHTWGDNWSEGDPDDASCGLDDLVDDTPNNGRPNYGCPQVIPDTCPGGGSDMIDNYMDYSDDACFSRFTAGQKDRMQGVLAGSRLSLANSKKCVSLSGTNDDASVEITLLKTINCSLDIIPFIKVTNWGDNTLEQASIAYSIDGNTPELHYWSGSLANGKSEEIKLPTSTLTEGQHTFDVSVTSANNISDKRACNDTDTDSFNITGKFHNTQQVFLTLTLDDFAIETSWEFRDNNDELIASKSYTNDESNSTINETFKVNLDECYTFKISDSSSDGICCNFSNGSYQIKIDSGEVIAEGGDFHASETIVVSTTQLGGNDKNELEDSEILLYPNPTNNILSVKISDQIGLPDRYIICNMLGQIVRQERVLDRNQLKIDVSTLKEESLYFIKVFKEEKEISASFFKN